MLPGFVSSQAHDGDCRWPLRNSRKSCRTTVVSRVIVGTWVVADEEGKPTEEVISIVKSTAGGSVLHETLFPGAAHEMITLYYTKDDHLMLTHYCGCTNHPIMTASKDEEGNLRFDCIGRGENFDKCADTPHMHDAIIRRDGNRIHSTRADLLDRLGRRQEAREAWRRGLELAGTDTERDFLLGRLDRP